MGLGVGFMGSTWRWERVIGREMEAGHVGGIGIGWGIWERSGFSGQMGR